MGNWIIKLDLSIQAIGNFHIGTAPKQTNNKMRKKIAKGCCSRLRFNVQFSNVFVY